MITVNGYKLNPTIFPDKTSQVWKLPDWLMKADDFWIDWRYENDNEFFYLAQFKRLLKYGTFRLYIPYLPYARQDKDIENNSTWALSTFASLLNGLNFTSVESLDVHNQAKTNSLIERFVNKPAYPLHSKIIRDVKPEIIIFPDQGAYNRYPHLHDFPHAVATKVRDQASGRIVNYELDVTKMPNSGTVLVVDDICDGGATFEMLSKEIYERLRKVLFVTHGVFSKGTEKLRSVGYNIYTTNSFINREHKYSIITEYEV